MRTPEYLSPTSLSVWKKDQEQYYLQYLADKRPPRDPQTQPMSVGSAFDAYIKSHLYNKHLPNGPLKNEFDFEKIFKDQVEEANRTWALKAGFEVFEVYKKSGALADLSLELSRGKSEPRFEFTVKRTIEGVPLLGKPDVWFVNCEGQPIILDWKVNGYCSKGRSPSKGYIRLRDESGNLNKSHRDAIIFREHGILLNSAYGMEDVDIGWATQISTYAWLCGATIGDNFVSAIDQIYRSRKGTLNVAEHRCRIGKKFQEGVLQDYQKLWEIINSGHIFRELPLSESLERQSMLDEVHVAYKNSSLLDFMRGTKPQIW